MMGLIYLVQPTDFVGTDIYKIGMSNSNTIKRIRSYGRRCINVVSRECDNPLEVENELIKAFESKFGDPIQGNEWFKGDKLMMINAFDKCIATYAKYSNAQQSEDSFSTTNLLKFIEKHVMIAKHSKAKEVNKRYYEFINIVPDSWFSNQDQLLNVVCAIRNEIVDQGELIATLHSSLKKRVPNYYKGLLVRYLTHNMKFDQKRHKIITLIRKAGNDTMTSDYLEWKNKFNPKTKNNYYEKKKKLVYKEGASMKLKDIQKHFDLTAKQLLQKNNRWSSKKINICIHCSSKHKKGCCAKYSRAERTSQTFITNIEIV